MGISFGGGTDVSTVQTPQQQQLYEDLRKFYNPMLDRLGAFAMGNEYRPVTGYESVYQPGPLISSGQGQPYWDFQQNMLVSPQPTYGPGQWIQEPIYGPAQNVTSLYDIPEVPDFSQIPGVDYMGAYQSVRDIPMWQPTTPEVTGYDPLQYFDWGVPQYTTQAWQAPGAPQMSSYNVYGADIPGRYEIPDIPDLPIDYTQLSDPLRRGIERPFERGAEKLREQLASIGGLGSQAAGVSGAGAAGLGEYWAEATPAMAMTGFQMLAPQREALMEKWTADVGSLRSKWETDVAAEVQKTGARNEMEKTVALANQQSRYRQMELDAQARGDYATAENARRLQNASWQMQKRMKMTDEAIKADEYFADKQNVANMWLAGQLTEADKQRYATEANTTKEEIDKYLTQEQADRDAQRAGEMERWREMIIQGQIPWMLLPGIMGGTPATFPTPVVEEEPSFSLSIV